MECTLGFSMSSILQNLIFTPPERKYVLACIVAKFQKTECWKIECCTAALRNCEGAYSGILEKAFTIKYSSHSTKGIYS